jgi:hypothetical protein
VDPGLIAGVAVLTVAFAPYIEGGIAASMSTKEWAWQEAVSYIERWCRQPESQKLSIGSERYTMPTGRSVVSAQLDAIECNGALRWLSAQCKVTFELQPRAEVKKLVTDAILKKLGWYRKTKDGHANDAARHAGFRLFTTHPELWLRLTS